MTKNPNTERALRLGNRTPGSFSNGVPTWMMKEKKRLNNQGNNQSVLSNKSFLAISIILILIGVGGYLMFGRKKR